MQVGVNVTCMHTNLGGHSLSGFGDIATFKNCQFSLSDHGLLPNACTPILVGVACLVSKILLLSKTVNFPFPTIVHGHQKI